MSLYGITPCSLVVTPAQTQRRLCVTEVYLVWFTAVPG